MKTRFEITIEEYSEPLRLYYHNNGFRLDKERGEVYKIYDKEIQLNEGDRVDLFGYKRVEWKCVDVENDTVIYFVTEE